MRAPRTLSATATVVALAFLTMLGTGTHTVSVGETLGGIAQRYGTSSAALARDNGIADPNHIVAGTRLSVPARSSAPGTAKHTVVKGETLGSIAYRYGTSIAALVSSNGLANPNLVLAGQVLTVPAGGAGPGAPASVSAAKAPAGGALHHLVRRGDTIAGIAARYGITQSQLIEANGLTNGVVYAGQRLDLVAANTGSGTGGGSITHRVAVGETLSGIARRFGTTVRALMEANDLSDADRVLAGQPLIVPSTAGGSSTVLCPVQGGAQFMNDWGFPRSGGRFHEGNDLFAPHGTPVVAVVAGEVQQTTGRIGGNQVKLFGVDGVAYYYTHLDRFGKSGSVAAGEVVGYVGTTGNAAGGTPHVHFEVHPGAGAAVNPYPRFQAVC